MPPDPRPARSPRSEKKTRHVSFFAGATLAARLFAFAERKDVSVSRVLRTAAERYLNDREGEGEAGT